MKGVDISPTVVMERIRVSQFLSTVSIHVVVPRVKCEVSQRRV